MTPRRTTRRRLEEQEGLQEVENRERIADFSSLMLTALLRLLDTGAIELPAKDAIYCPLSQRHRGEDGDAEEQGAD
ncbi:hypothetical protein OsI_08684 [Oryza sativa Indica Group]|uniref:Uncharacterized protein n=1 Tax=Oryza sativa subsp. indica TaxID=39946 RepID=B8AHL8_ORYSI|nr:hypothetical protein OsI_08684 [Oryza sativa Indica Group]